jgi:protein SCO1/2
MGLDVGRFVQVMRARAALVVVSAVVVVVAACGMLPGGEPTFHGTTLEPSAAPDFELTSHAGATYQLSDRSGRVVLLFFGYTYCPDVCPTTLAEFNRIHELLGADADRVDFVFVTVDPDRDTPARLAQHLAVFNPAFIGLTGDEATLTRVWKDYGVYRAKSESETQGGDYLMDHTSATYLVDTGGNLRLVYSFGTPAEDIAADIRQLLRRG